ncbi:hypothetical protein AX14_006691, partial [Amanita brunnescens Koide BX004]
RCFNCCTTDTSTWRRSNLSPGKVLCNKCGLFERTHSRPRPEQFPHKRGPLTGTALSRSRTPPTNQLPPISTPYNHYSHPSIAPIQDHHARRDYQLNPLPGLQTWHPNDSSGPPGPHPSVVGHGHSHGGHGSHSHSHGHASAAPISLPPPSTQHNGHSSAAAQQGQGAQGQGSQGQGQGQGPTSSQGQQISPPPVRRSTADSSTTSPGGARPSSPASARPQSANQERDSPKSVA